MAIKITRPTFYKLSADKEFTDRTEPRKAKSMPKKIPWINRLKTQMSKIEYTLGDKFPLLDTETANMLLFGMADA